MDISFIDHLQVSQNISNMFPFIDVNGYRKRFNCAMHFLTEQNFSELCNTYIQVLLIKRSEKSNCSGEGCPPQATL